MRVVKALRLPLKIGEQIITQIELNFARDANDDPAREEQKNALEHGDQNNQ